MSAAGLCRLALVLVVASPLASAQPPHYQVIDYETLGGSNSFYYIKERGLNNAGELIYQSDTATPDPVGYFNGDGVLVRGIAARRHADDLGAPLGQLDRDNSYPAWIADNGLIAGDATNGQVDVATGAPELRGVLWQAGHGIALGDLGGHGSQALTVNNAGMVAGIALDAVQDDLGSVFYYFPTVTRSRAFVWRDGTMQDIGTLGGPSAIAFAINDAGQVAGNSMVDATLHEATGLPTIHPFLWQGGKMRDIGALGGTVSVVGPIEDLYGAALNRAGQIAGTSTLAGDTVAHAFLWTNGRLRDLGTLGGANSQSLAINDNGDVVGKSDLTVGSRVFHAFFWHNGRMNDLGTLPGCDLSKAFSVNNRGDSVGIIGACSGDTIPSGFLSEAGAPMIDLNDLVVGAPDMWIYEAYYINNASDIAATAILPSGDVHAVLLKRSSATGPIGLATHRVRPTLHGGALGRALDAAAPLFPARRH